MRLPQAIIDHLDRSDYGAAAQNSDAERTPPAPHSKVPLCTEYWLHRYLDKKAATH